MIVQSLLKLESLICTKCSIIKLLKLKNCNFVMIIQDKLLMCSKLTCIFTVLSLLLIESIYLYQSYPGGGVQLRCPQSV